MSSKSISTPIKWFGTCIISVALILFVALLALESYKPTQNLLPKGKNDYQANAILNAANQLQFTSTSYPTSFALTAAYKNVFDKAKDQLANDFNLGNSPKEISEWDFKLSDYQYKQALLPLVKASSTGPISNQPWLWWGLTFGLAILGGLIYIIPNFSRQAGIHHDGIYFSPLTRGITFNTRSILLVATIVGTLIYGYFYMNGQYLWPAVTAVVALLIIFSVSRSSFTLKSDLDRNASAPNTGATLGMLFGFFLISFYILLYWFPQHITPWILINDPISKAISGNPASQWFLYGIMYTIVVMVMGIRMFSKYKGNRYQQLRTTSIIFFQTCFAFLIPELLVRFNLPWYDFKNIWPLDYDFFFEWNINSLLQNGTFGLFILVWGTLLTLIAVPVFTYFFGKRWYCSWVCGCGGLAETLGDPFRQLSDKSLKAWKYERYIIHTVLAFAIVMTILVLWQFLSPNTTLPFVDSYQIRTWYGFFIGSAFAGVVGTGFYPLMGNRVWCRFGCPLAAYLGLIQRFKSRFRITTNGGQCISCGNCSTYCEMGIDVRSYAQRGQDIVRASCVGCGVCASVCPRGVLRLENGPNTGKNRADEVRTIHVPADQVGIL